MVMGTKALYPRFWYFSVKSFDKYIYLIYSNGLICYPQLYNKFKTNDEYPLQSNGFFVPGPSAARLFKSFKCYFPVQDPVVPTPPFKTNPNWEIYAFFYHIQEVSWSALLLLLEIVIDEKTVGFKGRHQDKRQITHKAEGGGFKIYVICYHGFTNDFCLINKPPSKKYTDIELSPLHARYFHFFNPLRDNFHECHFDHLHKREKLHMYLSHITLNMLRRRECIVLIGRDFQRGFFSMR